MGALLKVTNFKLAIGIPLSFPMVHSEFFESYCMMEKGEHVLIRSKGGSIDVLRNGIVKLAQSAGCSHLLMFDTDMIYEVDTVKKLLDCDKDIVGALCFKRSPPFNPFMIKDGKGIEEWEDGSLVEVDRTGTGCLMIKMQVFDDIPSPYFQTLIDNDGMVTLGEDYNFCDKAREAGYEIYVNTNVQAEHLSEMRINKDFYRYWKGAREYMKSK